MVAAQFDLTGRTALVTGGDSGLGAAMARALSDAGASIVLVGRREDRLKATLGSRDGAIAAIDLVRQDAEVISLGGYQYLLQLAAFLGEGATG